MRISPTALRIGFAVFCGQSQGFVLPSPSAGRVQANPFPPSALRANRRQQGNPFGTLIGDMADSLLGVGKTAASASNAAGLDEKLSSLSPTWDAVRENLESKQTAEEKAFRDNLVKGYGAGSPLHKVRLYDPSNKEEDIRVTFFRDSASWCPYCQKVWMTLEEKKIPYRIEKINMRCYGEKPREFLAMQPSGNIPVAIIDGTTYGQSNDIMYAVESLFPDHKSLRPPKGMEMEAQGLLRLERQIFSAWMYWLTSSGDAERFREAFIATLQEVEAALSKRGPFFLGKYVSLVDFMFAPFLERMAASLLFFKGFQFRVPKGAPTDYPAVNKWFDAMETLPSYQLTKSDYYTHCWDLPPQLGGCTYEPAGEQYENAINGVRSIDGTQGSWELPLQPHNGGIEPDWDGFAGDEPTAKREAVERLSANHEAIIKFAARGAGRKGMPPYMAALADPNATPNEAVQGAVGSILKIVCVALLDGVDGQTSTMQEMADSIVKDGGKDYAASVVSSLVYLRDRVGVPRDMKLPGARQLRAHLNWAIGFLLQEQDAS